MSPARPAWDCFVFEFREKRTAASAFELADNNAANANAALRLDLQHGAQHALKGMLRQEVV